MPDTTYSPTYAHKVHVLMCLVALCPELIEDRPDVAQRRHCVNPRRPMAMLPYPERKRHTMTSDGQILTAERSHLDRQLWELERAADLFLKDNGETVTRLDVIDRDSRLPIVAPDRISFRGVARYRKAAPMRYGQSVRIRWTGTPWQPIKVTLCETTVIGRGVKIQGCTGEGWFGVRKLTDTKGHKASKARTAVKRKNATGTRGVMRTAWSLSERSLPRAWQKADAGQQAIAQTVESVLVTSTIEREITLSPGLVVTTDGATAATLGKYGPSARMTVRSLARRAALARLALD